MRRFLSLIICTGLAAVPCRSQLKIDNAVFYIGAGATVTVQGNVTSNVDIQGPGLLLLKGSSLQNIDMGGFTIPNLELDNAAHATLLNTNARIGTAFTLTNGRFRLGNQTLRIAPGINSIGGISSTRFIETSGSGALTKEGLAATAFIFPVGYSGTEFNPLTISNAGVADDIAVRCLQHVLENGLSGIPVVSDFANNSWVVTEAIAGSSDLTLTGEWAVGDELPGFNRLKSGIARFNTGTDWDLPASNVIAASGSGPYSRNRNSIITPGVFAPADLEKVNSAKMSIKIFLQGNYNATTGRMSDLLRDDPGTGGVDPMIPTVQPYNAAMNTRFTRVGIYDGSVSVNESVNATVFDVTGDNAIVDWVYVSTLDPVSPAVKLQTRAALLQRDGDIVDLDGVSRLSMPIDNDGNYHFLVSHRNHLSVRTPGVQPLGDNVNFDYNFSDLQTKAFQNIALPPGSNAAMASVAGTFPAFVLWGGNINANNNVRYTGPGPDHLALLTILGGNTTTVLNPVYSLGDVNLNRFVRYTGPTPDHLALLNILGGNTTNVRVEHQ